MADTIHIMLKQSDEVGCEWDQRRHALLLSGDVTVTLTTKELVELGVELLVVGTKALTEEQRWPIYGPCDEPCVHGRSCRRLVPDHLGGAHISRSLVTWRKIRCKKLLNRLVS